MLAQSPGLAFSRTQRSSNLAQVLDKVALTAKTTEGHILFRDGEPVTGVYVVRTGMIELLWGEAGLLCSLKIVGPGGVIGLRAALNGTYTATARASQDSELGLVPADRVLEIFEIDRELCCVAMSLMGREIAGCARH